MSVYREPGRVRVPQKPETPEQRAERLRRMMESGLYRTLHFWCAKCDRLVDGSYQDSGRRVEVAFCHGEEQEVSPVLLRSAPRGKPLAVFLTENGPEMRLVMGMI